MKSVAKYGKYGLFAILMAILVLPFVQHRFRFYNEADLKGDVTAAKADTFSLRKWFAGTYQQNTEKYINESFGFRNIMVRLNNQLDYSLFHNIHAKSIVDGKSHYLYEHDYIKAYYGTDFIGENDIERKVRKLKFIQDTLAKLHKTLLIVFAPSKASYYPEYIPDSCRRPMRETNYACYIKDAAAAGLNFIDFNRYFVEHKQSTKYPLYPQYGVHWSYYGSCLATDSIIKYIDKSQHINMPDIYWNHIDESYKPRVFDYDIAEGMNLLFPLKKNEKLGYPDVMYQPAQGHTKPALLAAGDSYFFGLYYLGLSHMFSRYHFYYYNKEVFPESEKQLLIPSQLNLKDEVNKSDVIMIMTTTTTLGNMGWGFIENLYNMFNAGHTHYDETYKNVIVMRDSIEKDHKWMERMALKAKQKHISPDSMATIEAITIEDQKFKNRVAELKKYIKTDTKWMTDIRQKAKDRNLPVDSMITMDAIWVTEQKENK